MLVLRCGNVGGVCRLHRNGSHQLANAVPELFPHFVHHVLFGAEETVRGVVGPLQRPEKAVSHVEEDVARFMVSGRQRVVHRLQFDAILRRRTVEIIVDVVVVFAVEIQQTAIQSAGSRKARNYAEDRQEERLAHLNEWIQRT